ncbi:uncharacterized protein LOC133909832 [Phragmites australis]|uniref:uncharacterized protein LOC133909832 n=1 Tax=Phragmites australis TaxID=29695 RepID=UPI002D76CE7F|nr:uncharacterized protein LOC133909832 [Phragmites australis]
MRPMKMRNGEEDGSRHRVEPQSLVDVEYMLNEWEIHCLILVSFALQVCLFFFAGVRRRSSSHVLGVLMWLAYLSADSVAVFALGHLAVHAGGPRHRLVFLWAPFVLLHLGGQDTITAFSMQDNELWRRHLLIFAQQVALAVYDVAKSPWPDRHLLATVMLMFVSGCVKYAERTACLARARPARLMADFLGGFKDRIDSIKEMQMIARDDGLGSSRYLSSRAFTKFSLNPAMDVMSTDILPNYDWSVSRDIFSDLYSKISRLHHSEQKEYFRKAFRFAEERLYLCYQRLYTKALFRLSPLGALLHLVAFLSTSAAMVLFYVAVKGGQAKQTYSSADVAVSYVLLAGAVTLEVSSFLLSLFTREDLWSHPVICSCVRNPDILKCLFCMTCGNCALLLRRWRPPQHWSEKLAQYSVIGRSAQKASGDSLVPRCIVELLRASDIELDTATTERVPVTDDLRLFVIKKLLDADTMLTDSDFTGSRGEQALRKWMGSLEVPAGTGILSESLRELDFPTSVLVWHIATDVCFFNAAAATGNEEEEKKKIISRQLSNYIMYLIFKRGVMRTSNSQFQVQKAHDEVLHLINAGKDQKKHHGDHELQGKKGRPREEVAVKRLLKSELMESSRQELVRGVDDAALSNPSASAIEVLSDQVLPRAFKVAAALDGIRGRQGAEQAASRWDLIAAVWLEMLYYVGPRCGAAFHRQHLSTGGELITHVLVLMYIIGPLGYHPRMLAF